MSVACTVHISATRLAAVSRLAGSDGQSKITPMSETRYGSSAKRHCTSSVRSSVESSACVAQECITEKVPYTCIKKVPYTVVKQIPYTVTRNVKGAWVKEMRVSVEDNKVSEYQVNMQVTFVLDE